jgi:PAS domain S-box-containing protein
MYICGESSLKLEEPDSCIKGFFICRPEFGVFGLGSSGRVTESFQLQSAGSVAESFMNSKASGQNQETVGTPSPPGSNADSVLNSSTATVRADMRRLLGRLSIDAGLGATDPAKGAAGQGNLHNLLSLIHWSDPNESLVPMLDLVSGRSLHQKMSVLLHRMTPDFGENILRFLRNPGQEHRFEIEIDAGQLSSRVLQASLFTDFGNDQTCSEVSLSFSEPSGFRPHRLAELSPHPALQCFFDNSREGLVLINAVDRQTIESANPAFCELLGQSLMSLQGRSIQSLQPAGMLRGPGRTQMPALLLKNDGREDAEFLTSSGEIVTVSTRLVEIRDSSGHLSNLALLTNDITEFRRTSRKMRRNETRLAIGEALAHMGSWEHVFHRNEIIWTDELYRIFELPIGSTIKPVEFLRYIEPEDRRSLLEQYRGARDHGHDLACEVRIRSSSGQRRVVRLKGRVSRDEPGHQSRLVGMAQDISERRRAEKIQSILLEISEATSRSANLEELLATVHRSLGTLVRANNFYIALYNAESKLYEFPFYMDERDDGFYPQRMDDSLTDIVRREGRPLVVNKTEQEEMVYQDRLRPYGPMSKSWLGVPLSDADEISGVIVLQDYNVEGAFSNKDIELVTYVAGYVALAIQRRRSSDRIRESEWQYRNLLDTMFEGLSTADTNGNFVYTNPALGRIMGLHPEQLVGRNINEFLSPEMQEISERQHELRKSGHSNRYELQIQRSDGQTRDVYLSVSPRIDRDGTYIGSYALVQDVTEMREIEQAVRDSELRYRNLVEQMSEGLASVDQDGYFDFANPALERILGIEENTAIGRRLLDFMDVQERDQLQAQNALRRQGQSSSYTLNLSLPDGETRSVLVSASPKFGQDGTFLGSLALVQDVTEKVKTQEILRQSEGNYRNLVNNISEGIFVVDQENNFTFANPALERMFGVEAGGLIGRCVNEFLDHTQKQILSRQDRLRLAGMSSSYQLRISRHDGQVRESMVSSSPSHGTDGTFRGASGVVQDITEQVQTLELLRANEEKFRHIYHNSPVMMYSIDSDGYIIDVNQKWLDETGYDRDEVIGHRADFLMVAESAMRLRQEYEPVFRRDGYIHDAPFTYTCRDGSLIEVLLNCEMSIDPSGRGISLAIVRNVTDQKIAEDQLRQVVIAVENAHEAIMTTDRDGTITYVNPAFEKITGYSREESIGNSPHLIASGEHDSEFYREMWQTISRGDVWHGKFVNRRKDGSRYQEEATISPVRNGRGQIMGYVAVKKDVTRQLNMEEQLKHSQKMEAIGTLAGGIAHDFNNILFAIVGNAEIAMDYLPANSLAESYLQAIIEASNRATGLVKQVLSYARKKESNKVPLQVDLLVREVLKLIRASLPATVEIRQNIVASNATVIADATEIHQLLMNLCTNAWQSMVSTGGILSVDLNTFTTDSVFLTNNPDLKPGEYLRLRVSDTGEGIPREYMSRIFEPFFTTKEVGKGTGMGLSVVHGIVHSLQGSISVDSTVGRGTSFDIILPLSRKHGSLSSTELPGQPGGQEHVLLVDDEQIVVDVVSNMLKLLGYRVTAHQSSQQAWQEFQADPARFDLVITDQTMPQLTGEELATRMMSLRSDVPVIMCTGFSQTLPPERAREIGIREYMYKPVKLRELGVALRRVLDSQQQPGSGPA